MEVTSARLIALGREGRIRGSFTKPSPPLNIRRPVILRHIRERHLVFQRFINSLRNLLHHRISDSLGFIKTAGRRDLGQYRNRDFLPGSRKYPAS